MIKLTKKTDSYWMDNGMGYVPAEWVVKGAEHLHVWSGGGNLWNVTNHETGEHILRCQLGRAFTLELLLHEMPELAD